MGQGTDMPGVHMAAECAQAVAAFSRAAGQDVGEPLAALGPGRPKAVYTIARGSSDAAANILSYEAMRELGVPVTSLPPSVFSIGPGVGLAEALMLVVSQSGASQDLVACAKGGREAGARVLAITNVAGSPVEEASDATIPIGAGEERAVPATKTVTGSIGAGLALIAALVPDYATRLSASVSALRAVSHPEADRLRDALLASQHVYVIGRDTGYGAAQEVALKLKECCALHAEAYSASEVLHGPLQLVKKPLTVLMLDTGQAEVQESLDTAEARFRDAGVRVFRLRPADVGCDGLVPGAAAALMLALVYPVVLSVALGLGLDPDRPDLLSKVTQTR